MTSTDLVERVARAIMAAMHGEPITDADWAGVKSSPADYETALSWANAAITALRTSQADERGKALLEAMLAAQTVQPYRGWNITELNKAADRARAELGLPSIRDLNPDLAAMQDKASANRDGFRRLLDRTDPSPDHTDPSRDAINYEAAAARFKYEHKNACYPYAEDFEAREAAEQIIHAALATPPEPSVHSDVKRNYEALIMAVARKWPGESRFETALRYIQEREQGVGGEPGAALPPAPTGGE